MGIKRKDILSVFKDNKVEKTFEEIVDILKINSKPRKKLMPLLNSLVSENILAKKNTKYFLLEKSSKKLIGRFMKSSEGYGFVSSEDGDVYLSKQEVSWNGIMDGDIIVYKKIFDKKNSKYFAKFVSFESRKKKIVGKLISESGAFFVELRKSSDKVKIERGRLSGARDSDWVEVEIKTWPYQNNFAYGEVLRKIDSDFELVINDHGLRSTFSNELLKEANSIQEPSQDEKDYKLDLIDDGKEKRKNLTHLDFVTIDDEDAMDFDDAIYCEKQENYFKLYVSIADVSHYVSKDSLIDKEARMRTTSVYFPGFVIPMLPERLSNKICCLEEGKYRYTMTTEFLIDNSGIVKERKIYKSVIKSKKRLNYKNVQTTIDKKDVIYEEEINNLILVFYDLYKLLVKKAIKRGKINLNIEEAKVIVDAKGDIKDIKKRESLDAHKLIEEFMILSNIATALKTANLGIYRVHEKPSDESLSSFSEIAKAYNANFNPDWRSPKEIISFLNSIKGKPYEKVLNKMLLRSFKKAKYSSENLGHFALSLENYSHFTSPIRRYPDLITHRLIKNSKSYDKEELVKISDETSVGELKAMNAERDVVKIKQARFLEKRIGEIFKAEISGFSDYKVFLELKDFFIEGFSFYSNEFTYDSSRMEIRKKNKILKLGDELEVELLKVDVFSGNIEFIIKI